MKILIKYITFLVLVYNAAAISSFFKEGQRAKIYEMTDDEVPIFRVSMPPEDFALLKSKANYADLLNFRINVTSYLENFGNAMEKVIDAFTKINYNEKFPDISAAEVYPELKIDENGQSHIDPKEVIKGFDLDPKSFQTFDFAHNNMFIYLVGSNPNFNVFKLVPAVGINVATLDVDLEFLLNFSIFVGGVEGDTASISNDFKTKNATLKFEIKGEVKTFEKITISLSGNLSRTRSKLNYNIKIRGKDDLYGRKYFKLRSDDVEPSFLRNKVISDIHNRLGLPSSSANYAYLYINDEFMGFYIFVDSIKPSWVEFQYGEVNTTSLYQCKEITSFLSVQTSLNSCENKAEDDLIPNTEDWAELLKTLDNAKSAKDVENIFDVDQFLYEMALEYLTAGWDHLVHNGHNYLMYKNPKNGKWLFLSYDYDLDLGQNIDRVFLSFITIDLPERLEHFDRDYPNYTIQKWISNPFHLIKILILDDPTRFNKILAKVVKEVFNPAVLFPHIDELKKFIKPYVEKDKTRDANGMLPGRLNHFVNTFFTMEEWDANSEFTTVTTFPFCAYGIKYWILAKYRNVCKTYKLECDPVYMDENYEYTVNKDVEFKGYLSPEYKNHPGNGAAIPDMGLNIDPSAEPGADPSANPGTNPGANPGTNPDANPGANPSTNTTDTTSSTPNEDESSGVPKSWSKFMNYHIAFIYLIGILLYFM